MSDITHQKPEMIAHTFVNYFRFIFSSSNTNSARPFLNSHLPNPTDDATYLLPSKDEIFQILKDMKRNASPGPGGFNVEFYLAAWSWIGDEVTTLVQDFFKTGILPPHIADTNIALIPKKLVPIVPTDYRPISVCNIVYKIIAKAIANRLKPHLPDYIDPTQQAFIKGRCISDNIIIAQEITHSFSLSSWNNNAFMVKIDLAKAFDRLEWNFIVAALLRKGLHGHFINLIHACIASLTFSVIINVHPTQKFKSQRGIRQGCPLSPYVFVLAINELSLRLNDAMQSNFLQGISLRPNCPSIHFLLFADDLLVCDSATFHEAYTMYNIIQHFCAASGQTPNWSKSSILFSSKVLEATKTQIKGVRDNLAGRSLCLRAWRDICQPKEEGGLGLRNLQAINEGLILSVARRISNSPLSHLYQDIHATPRNSPTIISTQVKDKNIIPKVKTFAWRLFRKALPTGMRAGHPHASLSNILNWLWCLWKDRNDNLFNRKKSRPHHLKAVVDTLKSFTDLARPEDQTFTWMLLFGAKIFKASLLTMRPLVLVYTSLL